MKTRKKPCDSPTTSNVLWPMLPVEPRIAMLRVGSDMSDQRNNRRVTDCRVEHYRRLQVPDRFVIFGVLHKPRMSPDPHAVRRIA